MSRSFFCFLIALIAATPAAIDSTFMATVIASAYDQGRWATKDPGLAFRWYLKAAARGDPQSMFAVGCSYYRGEGIDPDPSAAFHWCKLAAADGYADAKIALGVAYQMGIGVRPDGPLGRRILRAEASSGNADAIGILANVGPPVRPHRHPVPFRQVGI
jgi:hypothetical protein